MKYEIKRTKRKTMTIQVHRNQKVLVRAPLRCSDAEVAQFFDRYSHWVNKKLQESKQYPGLPLSQYCNNGSLWLLGKCYPIAVVRGTTHCISLDQAQLLVTEPQIENEVLIRRRLGNWKRNFAKKLFAERLEFWFSRFPLSLPRYQFKIRKMQCQWGNCNQRGIITINSQLIRYPLSCIDYVIIHELTHLKHMHHGRNFYSLLEKVLPDWQQQRQLLARFSGETSDSM